MINIDTYDWGKLPANIKKAKEIRKNIMTAVEIISDGLLRYKKKKLNAKSKKEAADMALAFKDLEDYKSRREIEDAYGWDMITEKERDRLCDLWDAREQYVDESGKFSDEATKLVQQAVNGLGAQYEEFLAETDEAERIAEKARRDADWRKAGN